jgi:hypothetical protein
MSIKPSTLLSSSISTISGQVSHLQSEILEYVNPEKPTHDHSSVYYKRIYLSEFTLDNQEIKAAFSSPMLIQSGDQITVSGYPKGSVFQVLAYQNHTQAVSGTENWWMLGLGALFFLAVAIGLLNSELVIEGAWIPKLFLIGFALIGIYMGYRALLIREAIKLIQAQ